MSTATCMKCGAIFTGPDPIAELAAHVRENHTLKTWGKIYLIVGSNPTGRQGVQQTAWKRTNGIITRP